VILLEELKLKGVAGEPPKDGAEGMS